MHKYARRVTADRPASFVSEMHFCLSACKFKMAFFGRWSSISAAARPFSLVTPVPGGVGPMTIAMLLLNTLQG